MYKKRIDQGLNGKKEKISKLINSKDGLVRGFQLVVSKGILNKTVRRTVQHLISLEKNTDYKKEVSIELNKCQEKPAKKLDYRNDTDRKTKISQNSGY